jgi:hypothetical protein
MTNVSKRMPDFSAKPQDRPAEDGAKAAHAAERRDFDHAMSAGQDRTSPKRTRDAAASAATSESRGRDDAPSTAGARAERERGRTDEDGSGGSGAGGGQDQRQEDSGSGRALPGDVMVPLQARLQAVEIETAHALQAADRAAEIQQIVDRLVEAVQVKLLPGGAAEARLELDMGTLGKMSVTLHRTEEGNIRVGFETATAQAAEMLKTHASELGTRLEARGIALQEITVAGADQPAFRLEGSAATDAPVKAAAAEDKGQARHEQGDQERSAQERRSADDERQRRREHEELPSDDD